LRFPYLNRKTLEFEKRCQLFVGPNDESLSVVAVPIRQAESESERLFSESIRVKKRYLKARSVFQALRKRRGRLLIALIGLAVIFSGVAAIQHWFVHRQVYHTASQELSSWAEQVADEVAYRDKWDLEGYRQSAIPVPAWYVLTRDGLVIDIEGFIPGIFGRVYGMDDSIFTEPTSLQPRGEAWRLSQRPLVDESSPQLGKIPRRLR